MLAFDKFILIHVFVRPEFVLTLDLSQWDLLVRQARSADVLARLGFLLKKKGLYEKIPDKPLNHFDSAIIYVEQFNSTVHWELRLIHKALIKYNVPLILLKGAAYVHANNDAANGRLFTDIDILVKNEQLKDAEKAFISQGWVFEKLDKYDQEYYRKWMHELPPMRHFKRGTNLDVHHNILPLTSRKCPNADKLLANLVQDKSDGIWVLAPEDRVLHSAIHLFYGGEFEHGFRDISDLDLLFREFAKTKGFWNKLLDRAEEIEQNEALYYAIHYPHLILNTPIPEFVLEKVEISFSVLRRSIMDFIFIRALMPDHESCNDRWTGISRWILYGRSHWLKMPLHLLIPHLLRKSWLRLIGKETH